MIPTDSTIAPDTHRLAEEITFSSFLNSYIREFGNSSLLEQVPLHDPTLAAHMRMSGHTRWMRIELPATHTDIYCPLDYYSETGRHRFLFPVVALRSPDRKVTRIDVYNFSLLVMAEVKASQKEAGNSIKSTKFSYRLHDTIRNLACILNAERFGARSNSPLYASFIESEQNLLLGHNMHPLAKNRLGFSADDFFTYSPEFGNGFPLHYFLVQAGLVHEASIPGLDISSLLTEQLVAFAELKPSTSALLATYEGYKLLAVHPWQARFMLSDTRVKEWLRTEKLVNVGQDGPLYYATSSVRTVYSPTSPWMLKLSLNVQITNAERVNLLKELHAGYDTARLFVSDWGQRLRAEFPDFNFITDPGYMTLAHNGEVLDGFSMLIRENPFFNNNQNASLVATLCQDDVLHTPNRLAEIVRNYANLNQLPLHKAAEHWFVSYLDLLLKPLVRIYNSYGLALEAHQQNIVIGLDKLGYPNSVFFRDNQGYFIRSSSLDEVRRHVPDFGEKSNGVAPDAFIPPKYVYYLLVNNLFGVVNCLGRHGLAEEPYLLGRLRSYLQHLGAEDESGLVRYMLDTRSWEVKANLRMRLEDLNEDRLPTEAPAVFVPYHNPLIPVTGFCHELIYPKQGKILFSKYFEKENYTLTLRGYDHDLDFETVYDWVNQDYAKTFWQMDGSRQALESFYLKNLASDYTCSIVGLIDGVQAFIAEPYWPMKDPMGAYYDARKGDYGFHFIKRPVEPTRNKLFLNAFRTSVEFMFSFPEVERVVGEADHLNDKINDMCVSMGYSVEGLLVMPWKTAKLTICTRESHVALFPETAASLLAPLGEAIN